MKHACFNTLIFIDASATLWLEWYTMHARVSFCYQNKHANSGYFSLVDGEFSLKKSGNPVR